MVVNGECCQTEGLNLLVIVVSDREMIWENLG